MSDIKKLKESPMFNLSLSSKELFHSNFLAWIAEDKDKDTHDLFVSILELFGLDNETAKDYAKGIRDGRYIVKREYNNFDFCICENIDNWEKDFKKDAEDKIPGRVLLVLENKFKSIPYKAQLENYQEKVDELNKQASANETKLLCLNEEEPNPDGSPKRPNGNSKIYKKHKQGIDNKYKGQKCHFVLLSLAKEVCGLRIEGEKHQRYIQADNNNQWHFVTYKEYSETLKNQVYGKSSFKYDVISDYANYIFTFCEYLIKKIPQNILKESWTTMLSSNRDLVAIRMDDIWQKLIVNLIAIKFCDKSNFDHVFGNSASEFIVNKEMNGKVHVEAAFTRGTGILDVKMKIDDDCLFGIQVQDGYYKRLLETTVEKLGNDAPKFYQKRLEKLKDMYNFENEWKDPTGDKIFDEKDDKVHPTNKRGNRVFENFGGYDQTFICQSKKLSSDCTIEMVLNAIIADINSACQSCGKTLNSKSIKNP